jgi:predicted nucleic acid-binding protein
LGIYLDTSALAKLYRPEIGTAIVERIIDDSSSDCFISRLGVLEMRSVLARKTRAGEISSPESALVLRRFRKDIRLRRFRVQALRVRHYEVAEKLVEAYGPTHGLRTLDSLHLAGALDLKAGKLIDSIVVADKILARVAALEGLLALDPEASTPNEPELPGAFFLTMKVGHPIFQSDAGDFGSHAKIVADESVDCNFPSRLYSMAQYSGSRGRGKSETASRFCCHQIK